MCGRFAFLPQPPLFEELFDLPLPEGIAPRYNLAPTQPMGIVRDSPQTGGREFTFVLWGLVPGWSKDMSFAARLINARSETAAEKPSFRAAFRHRRCLVPATHFYEWKRTGKNRQPYMIRRRSREMLAFAGLWERWTDPTGSEVQTGTILTCAPNPFMADIHHRMPVILQRHQFPLWLSAAASERDALIDVCQPYPLDDLEALPVSTYVNNARHEGPETMEPPSTSESAAQG